MHGSLCHWVLHSGTSAVFSVCVFGIDSKQLRKQESVYWEGEFSTKHFVLIPKLLVHLLMVAVASHFKGAKK